MGKFKKGDVLVATAEQRENIVDHWNRYWLKSQGPLSIIYATSDGSYLRYSNKPDGDGPSAPESWFDLWQPKVGDRVRYNNPEYGEATVIGIIDEKHVKVDTHGSYGICTERLSSISPLPVAAEAQPVAAAWVPAVGDRVVGTVGAPKGLTGIIIDDDHSSVPYLVRFDGFDDGHGEHNNEWWLSDDDIAPAQEAPLTITAGRYYKTRDGRKVGPTTDDGLGIFSAPEFHNYWYETGLSYSDGDQLPTDLIAEWVDEPTTTNVGAQVDVINEEYGPVVPAPVCTASNDNTAPAKFKVGDRVRSRVTWGDTRPGDILPVTDVRDTGVWATDRVGDSTFLANNEIELVTPTQPTAIVALIEDGQPKLASDYLYDDGDTAAIEASRLALKHPGQQFGVFVLADSKIADEVITKTAVLRAA